MTQQDGELGETMERRRPSIKLSRSTLLAGCVFTAATFTVPYAAWAQTPPVQSPLLQQVPQGSPLPHILPPQPSSLGAGLPQFRPLNAAGALPSVTIPVRSVGIIGATAFPASQLDGLTAGLAGQSVPLARIEAARRSILDLYRQHGFVLSSVSAEIDNAGNVRFIVTEGRITEVKLSQDIGPAGTMVLRFLDHLTAERPVSEASLERWLLLAEQVPGVSVHAVLQPSPGDPGALVLIAEVSRAAVSGLVTADNRGFKETGPEEAVGVLDVNSLTSFGDQTEVSLFHTSGGTDNFGQISEGFFIGSSGLRVRLYYGAGQATPGGLLRQIGYHSFTTVFGAHATYPLILRRDVALEGNLFFDGFDGKINTAGLREAADSLRTIRLGLKGSAEDDWLGGDRTALNNITFGVSKGLPILGASADGRPIGVAGRAGERIDFYKFNGELERVQTLFSPWDQASVALRGVVGGQATSDILPSAEELYLGGTQFTRGFYAGQVVGDNAAYATVELQLNTGVSFTLLKHDINTAAQFYTFYDWGETWQNQKTDPNHRLESGGVGLRLGLTRFLELDVEAVHRITTQLTPKADGIAPLSETAIYWGVVARY